MIFWCSGSDFFRCFFSLGYNLFFNLVSAFSLHKPKETVEQSLAHYFLESIECICVVFLQCILHSHVDMVFDFDFGAFIGCIKSKIKISVHETLNHLVHNCTDYNYCQANPCILFYYGYPYIYDI